MTCASCNSEMPVNGAFCTSCGASANMSGGAAAAAMPATSGLADNVAGALAYFTIIPAIIFLVVPEYSRRPFVKFHAFQSLFLGITAIGLDIVLMVIPVVGWILVPILALALFVVWLITVIKAFNGKEFQLPVLGALAAKQARGQ